MDGQLDTKYLQDQELLELQRCYCAIVYNIPSELRGRFVLVSLHDPFFVVYLAELHERQPQFLYGFRGAM
jgi:hypothetical protein